MLLDHPEHVPGDLVRDFDFYNLPQMVNGYTDDVHACWKSVQDTFPRMFWTPHHGGCWVLTRYQDMFDMVLQPGVFSNRDNQIPQGKAPFLIPVNLDPPQHTAFRKLVQPFFSPANLNRVTELARSTAIGIIEQLQPRGRCEFVADFAGVMPIAAFLTLVNLPLDDLHYLRELATRLGSTDPRSPASWAEMGAYVRNVIEDRRARPREDDLFSALHLAEVDNRRLDEEEIFNTALLFTAGGLDTVVSQMSFDAAFLATSPAHRRELIEHPERIDHAIEELFRRFGVSNLARQAAQDAEFLGQTIRAGDAIMLPFPIAGLDETVNPDPMTVNFQRKGIKHLLFSSGPHLCIGNRLAKREIRIFLEEWLKRIPDFSYAPGTAPKMTAGLVNGIEEMELVWDA